MKDRLYGVWIKGRELFPAFPNHPLDPRPQLPGHWLQMSNGRIFATQNLLLASAQALNAGLLEEKAQVKMIGLDGRPVDLYLDRPISR